MYSAGGAGNVGGQEIDGLAPGTYRVQWQDVDAKGQSGTFDEVLTLTASGPVTVGRPKGLTVGGRAVFSGSATAGGILIIPHEGQVVAAPIEPDGKFTFQRALPPGQYRVNWAGQGGLVPRSIDSGQGPIPGNLLTIPARTSGALDLTVSLGPAATSEVSGIALRDGKPVEAAMVLLLPLDAESSAPIGKDQTDSDGTFTISNLDPGRYTLLAIDGDSSQLEYRNPAAIKPYLAHGKPVTVPLKSKEPISVNAIPLL
jgi:hypothetical protein